MKKRIFNILASVMILVCVAWSLFILCSYYGYNNGYKNGYQYAAKDYFKARDKYFEARNKLMDALIDVLKYKTELLEKKADFEESHYNENKAHFSDEGWSAVGGCTEHDNCCVSSNLNSGVVTHETIINSDAEPINIMPHYNLKGEK